MNYKNYFKQRLIEAMISPEISGLYEYNFTSHYEHNPDGTVKRNPDGTLIKKKPKVFDNPVGIIKRETPKPTYKPSTGIGKFDKPTKPNTDSNGLFYGTGVVPPGTESIIGSRGRQSRLKSDKIKSIASKYSLKR